MLVTFIFTFEIAEVQICMVNFSIGMPIFAPLNPQPKIFQIDLKVWRSHQWVVLGWVRKTFRREQMGVKIFYRQNRVSPKEEAWEEAHPHSQKQIFQKAPLDALKSVTFLSHWRERFPKFERLGAFRKIILRLGDSAISNICLIHKIALVWSISRNIFLQVLWVMVQLKKYNKK